MDIKSIYVNLPIQDVQKTRSFWTVLGFAFHEEFSNEKALALVLKKDSIYAMLLQKAFFHSFTNREVADGSTTQVITAIEVDSKEQVDQLVRTALANGATRYRESIDYGWMYYDSFADLDGHQWEVMYTDLTLLPK